MKWDNSEITYWGTADLIAGNGPQRGYFVNEHSDGDRDFGTFEGKIVTSEGQVTIEGVWIFTGGTGKLEGLTGGGSYKGKMTSPVEVENTWEGAYEIAEQARAACERDRNYRGCWLTLPCRGVGFFTARVTPKTAASFLRAASPFPSRVRSIFA